MSVEVLFRVAAIGLMAAVLTIVLKSAGREDIALICNLGALVLALGIAIQNFPEGARAGAGRRSRFIQHH